MAAVIKTLNFQGEDIGQLLRQLQRVDTLMNYYAQVHGVSRVYAQLYYKQIEPEYTDYQEQVSAALYEAHRIARKYRHEHTHIVIEVCNYAIVVIGDYKQS